MKKFVYLVFSIILLNACDQEKSNVVIPDSKSSLLSAITSTDPLSSASEVDPLKLAKLTNKNARASYTEYGPFTANATYNYHRAQRLDFTSNQSLYPPGTYDCDVSISVALVTLPANAIPIFVGASKMGYTENGYHNQIEGVTRSEYESGGNKTYRMVTYSIVPIYIVGGGQFVNPQPVPRSLLGNTYTYKYLIL